ncbi:putative ribonuclease [Phycisphaera mikurensis NBRC 102666]|uniref:Putative ribonuclease n=1 Tax=Phycisphaera mikurensis (strain NBRC 102666 / KCTC 22515 / FYK2301M01) TaxID=1142394 RepID=I0ICX8_PHYMF|nr:putative ribonuclease [Phycisphaera mikurensis NBRC 102666]
MPVAEWTANGSIEGVYAANGLGVGQTRAGKDFLKGTLSDKTGRAPMRMWSVDEKKAASLGSDGFVWVKGKTSVYQGEMQVVLDRIEPAEPNAEDLAQLLPTSNKDVDRMFQDVLGLLATLENPAMKCLRDRFLEDQKLMGAFCEAPAAKVMHHAWLGGLLEHTLDLMTAGDRLVGLYPGLNRDLVLMGLFVHDLGKVEELTWKQGFGYTDAGNLIGHLVGGMSMLDAKIAACADPRLKEEIGDAAVPVPEKAAMVLRHIVISHHGQPDFGAAKIPSTPEALFVSMLDNLDAKMAMTMQAVERDRGNTGFTDRLWALDTRMLREDPLH